MEVKICTGCGWLSTDKIEAPALACCPDSHYVPIKEHVERLEKIGRFWHNLYAEWYDSEVATWRDKAPKYEHHPY